MRDSAIQEPVPRSRAPRELTVLLDSRIGTEYGERGEVLDWRWYGGKCVYLRFLRGGWRKTDLRKLGLDPADVDRLRKTTRDAAAAADPGPPAESFLSLIERSRASA